MYIHTFVYNVHYGNAHVCAYKYVYSKKMRNFKVRC